MKLKLKHHDILAVVSDYENKSRNICCPLETSGKEETVLEDVDKKVRFNIYKLPRTVKFTRKRQLSHGPIKYSEYSNGYLNKFTLQP